jgi:glycosyltransferase involved in cell wall biosynthesis
MKNITLIIPAKEESESLPLVLEELKKFDFTIKIILKEDDVETINSIKEFNCEIIFQNGTGYGNALINGINNTNTEYVCIFNADGSFNPAELTKMFELMKSSESDFIFASRYKKNGGSDDDSLLTFIGNKIFSLICRVFLSINLTDVLYTFVLSKTNSIKQLNLKQNDFKLCIELPYKASINKFLISSMSSYERKRFMGKKKVNEFRDGFKILTYIIKLFFNGGRDKN